MRGSHFKIIALMTFLLALAGAQPLPAQRTPIEPVKSFPDIPPLPKSTAEVQQRIGKMTDPGGNHVVGDEHSQTVNSRLFQWKKDMENRARAQASQYIPRAMNPSGAGAMNADTGRMIGQLQTGWLNLNAGLENDGKAYVAARGQVEDAFQKDLDQIYKEYADHPTGNCSGAYISKFLKAGDNYLSKLATPYGQYKLKMKHAAAQAQSLLDQANKTFGAHPPALALSMDQRLTNLEMAALGAVNAEENERAMEVYRKSVIVKLECNNQPHF
jgi:hypothetical protein